MSDFKQPLEIIHNGNSYSIRLVTGKVKEAFERKYVARAQDRLRERRTSDNLSRKEYLEELRLLGQREDKGDFAFVSEGALTTMLTTSWGQRTIFTLLMPDTPRDVLDELLEERSDDMLWLLERVIKASMPVSIKKAGEMDGSRDGSRDGSMEGSMDGSMDGSMEGSTDDPLAMKSEMNNRQTITTSKEPANATD